MGNEDEILINHMESYAAHLKKAQLTDVEKREIIRVFNEDRDPSTFKRAQRAVDSVVRNVVGLDRLEKSANFDNTQRLLEDLRQAAEAWAAKKK